jgi:hypothetical protein
MRCLVNNAAPDISAFRLLGGTSHYDDNDEIFVQAIIHANQTLIILKTRRLDNGLG